MILDTELRPRIRHGLAFRSYKFHPDPPNPATQTYYRILLVITVIMPVTVMMIVIVVIVPVPIKASYYERLEKRNANPSTLDSLLPSSYLIHIVPLLSCSISFSNFKDSIMVARIGFHYRLMKLIFFFFLRYTLNRSILIKLDEESYFNEWNHCTFSCFILIVINER